jgi:hypothetical protein
MKGEAILQFPEQKNCDERDEIRGYFVDPTN